MLDIMAEALKKHLLKSKAPVSGNSDDESLKGSQKGPGETDHAPSLDSATLHDGKAQEMRDPAAVEAGLKPGVHARGDPSTMIGHGMHDELGPESMKALHSLMTDGHQTGGPGSLESRGADKAKEMYASMHKRKEGKV